MGIADIVVIVILVLIPTAVGFIKPKHGGCCGNCSGCAKCSCCRHENEKKS